MTVLSLTDPTNGTVADANTIVSNNTATKAVVNGGIDNSNIATAAAIGVAKLAAGGNGQVVGMLAGVPTWLGGMAQISDQTVSGSVAANIDFSSIPATYNSLLLVLQGRGDTSALSTPVNLRANNDSGANYNFETLQGASATPQSSLNTAQTSSATVTISAATDTAGRAGGGIIFIPNYLGTTFHKTVVALGGAIAGANTVVQIQLGHWANTAAITRLTLLPGAGNFVIGSRATLYGLG